VGVDDTFSVTIRAGASSNLVSGISAFIDFDPDYLEVQSVTPGTALPTVLLNTFDNIAGTIDYSAGKLDEPFPTSTFDLATIEFRALALTDPVTAIEFSTAYPRVTTADYGGEDITGTLTGGTVSIQIRVDISIVLEGGSRPDDGWIVPITVSFFDQGADVLNDTPLEQLNLMTTKEGGTATCQMAIMPGSYDITIVSEHTLMNAKRDVVISMPSTTVDMGTLLEGNANDDNIINISDFGILAVAYMTMDGEPGYDARADFDRNGIINISDFGLLAVNYMLISPIDVSGP
jgi:hypothetical protein